MAVSNVSGTANPYESQAYVAKSNSKNTLTIESFVQLLAVQLQNQDLTSPMDSSDMMNQLSQMAMVQALSNLTEVTTANSNMSATSYVAGLIGKEVTVAVTAENASGAAIVTGSKTGIIETVNLAGGEPTFRLQGDSTDYPLSYLLGIGDVTDSINNGDESGEDEGTVIDPPDDKEDEGTVTDPSDDNEGNVEGLE